MRSKAEVTIRAYAVTDDKRVASAPHVPTVDEAGRPGFHMTLSAPRSRPASVSASFLEAL